MSRRTRPIAKHIKLAKAQPTITFITYIHNIRYALMHRNQANDYVIMIMCSSLNSCLYFLSLQPLQRPTYFDMFQFGRNPFHWFAFEKREQDSKTLNAKVFFRVPARSNDLQMPIRKWPVKSLDNSRLQRWSPIRLKQSICGHWGLGAEAC